MESNLEAKQFSNLRLCVQIALHLCILASTLRPDHALLHGIGQAFYAFFYFIDCRIGEIQPHSVFAGTVAVKSGTDHIGIVALQILLFLHLVCVHDLRVNAGEPDTFSNELSNTLCLSCSACKYYQCVCHDGARTPDFLIDGSSSGTNKSETGIAGETLLINFTKSNQLFFFSPVTAETPRSKACFKYSGCFAMSP